MSTSSRKLDHIRICLDQEVDTMARPLEDIVLLHQALPEIDEQDIDTSCRFLGKDLAAPLMICAMTGGHPATKEINLRLGQAASEMGIAIGVGSQRAALEDSRLEETFSVVREAAPDIPVIGNIGAAQLKRSGPEILEKLAEMIDADAIAIHLNFLQESIQPEGDRDGEGVLQAIKSAAEGPLPIMVKETGAGISGEVARNLVSAGIKMIDVSGTGGLSWAGVEAFRAAETEDEDLEEMGRLMECWGIPTPVSIVECRSAGAYVIASGGIRSGLDIARSLALGAGLAGASLPFLRPATEGKDAVVRTARSYIRALRMAMFLTGSQDLTQLGRSPLVVLGRTREWLEARGFDTNAFSVYREL
jgi:isopentenyl-diphosphate delta-isomerase